MRPAVGFRPLTQRRRVACDVVVAFSRREVLHQASFKIGILVEYEHRQQAVDGRPDHGGAAEIEVFGARFLTEHRHLMTAAAPRARQATGIDIRTRTTEQVTVPKQYSHPHPPSIPPP